MMQDKAIDVAAIKPRLLAKMGRYSDQYPEQIERQFPHILARIADLWGSAELVSYLDQLMFTDREGRQGFPPEVALEMFNVFDVHVRLGFAPRHSGTGWDSVDDLALERKASFSKR